MGARSRRKGHDWERFVVRLFKAVGWGDAARCLEEVRSGNCGDIVNVSPFSVQVKCGARPNVWQALEEAREARSPGDYSLAIVRKDHAGAVAVMRLNEFMDLLGMLKRERIL